MEIHLTVRTLREAIKVLGTDSDQLGYRSWQYEGKKVNDVVSISIDDLDLTNLTKLNELMRANNEDDTRKVSKLVNALKDSSNRAVPSLAEFGRFFTQYLKDNNQPLLHSLHADLRGIAYLPISVERKARYNNNEEYVQIKLGYNVKMQYNTYTISLYAKDIRESIPAILRRHNLMVPDETMTEDYEKIQARFKEFGNMNAEQFWCKGAAPVLSSSDYWWSSREDIELSQKGRPTKAVLDMSNTDKYGNNRGRSSVHSDIYDSIKPVPTHPVLPMFSLAHHKMCWVNVVNMRKYKYEEGLKDKLILPKSHVRLIGALVSNLDALRSENEAEDKSRTIKAKASASIILAKGPAGTGKTLTAEVYGEEIKRPLYEVQSGQIGTDPEDIEKNLQIILDRAIRLNMPLLINEADVFIQKRGRDLQQNAVVAVFLRLLEYHTGLVFLTTNRSDDIDDAILSRCIAEIAYQIPEPTERLKLWQIMLSEFNVTLSKTEVRKAVLLFPEVVGRDIQNLIRLTNRVCVAVEEPFSLEALRDNAVFKSIKVLSDAELEAEIAKRRKD